MRLSLPQEFPGNIADDLTKGAAVQKSLYTISSTAPGANEPLDAVKWEAEAAAKAAAAGGADSSKRNCACKAHKGDQLQPSKKVKEQEGQQQQQQQQQQVEQAGGADGVGDNEAE